MAHPRMNWPRLVALYAEGYTTAEVAAKLGVTNSAARQRARSLGVDTSRKDLWPPERTARLRVLWAAGHTAAHCAKTLGLTRGMVAGRLTILGLYGERTPIPFPFTPSPAYLRLAEFDPLLRAAKKGEA